MVTFIFHHAFFQRFGRSGPGFDELERSEGDYGGDYVTVDDPYDSDIQLEEKVKKHNVDGNLSHYSLPNTF